MAVFVMWVYKSTADLLFKSCSITGYWRPETGGNPDADDPYDLFYPMEVFRHRVLANDQHFMEDKSNKKEIKLSKSGFKEAFTKVVPVKGKEASPREKKVAPKVATTGAMF